VNLWLIWQALESSAWFPLIAALALAGVALLVYLAARPLQSRGADFAAAPLALGGAPE